MTIINKLTHWYFGKKVLPYWAVLLADTIIVFVSSIFIFLVANRSLITFENRLTLFYSSLFLAVISWVGAGCFKTYAGVLRYSSSVDLMKLAYGNTWSLVLALIFTYIFKRIGVEALSFFTLLETIVVFLISTLLMWALRLVVKIVYESATTNNQGL